MEKGLWDWKGLRVGVEIWEVYKRLLICCKTNYGCHHTLKGKQSKPKCKIMSQEKSQMQQANQFPKQQPIN